MIEPTDVQHMISKISELTDLSPDAVQHALRTIAPTQNVPEGDTARRLYYHLKSLPESDLVRMFWEALKGNAMNDPLHHMRHVCATGNRIYLNTPEQIARGRALEDAHPDTYVFKNYRLYFLAQDDEINAITAWVMDGIGEQPD